MNNISRKVRISLVKITVFLLMITAFLFPRVEMMVAPGMDIWADDTGISGFAAVDFSPFFLGRSTFIRTSFDIGNVDSDDLTITHYVLGVGPGIRIRPFSSLPMFIKPCLLLGAALNQKKDSISDESIFGGVIIPELDIAWELSDLVTIGTALKYKYFFGEYNASYATVQLYLSFALGSGGSSNRNLERVAVPDEVKRAIKRNKLGSMVDTGRKGELNFNISDILFESSSAKIRDSQKSVIRKIAGLLKARPGVQIMIEGHSDDVGSSELNLNLSQQRALNVKRILVQAGVTAEKIIAKGYGHTKPLVSNTTQANRAKNRRVVIKVIFTKEK